ncbi:MAG: hypothetical protein EB078_12075, partial [Proteobacteria bacterium]|nr:hypothetical protein [Pseudomonadota bacterium]
MTFCFSRALLLVTVLLGTSHVSLGEKLSNEQQKALSTVMEQLTNPEKRQEILKESPKAAQADQFLREVGGAYSEEIYKLAAQIMQTLAIAANGDPNKMEQLLEKAKKDPASFANSFTPEQKSSLKKITDKL